MRIDCLLNQNQIILQTVILYKMPRIDVVDIILFITSYKRMQIDGFSRIHTTSHLNIIQVQLFDAKFRFVS